MDFISFFLILTHVEIIVVAVVFHAAYLWSSAVNKAFQSIFLLRIQIMVNYIFYFKLTSNKTDLPPEMGDTAKWSYP